MTRSYSEFIDFLEKGGEVGGRYMYPTNTYDILGQRGRIEPFQNDTTPARSQLHETNLTYQAEGRKYGPKPIRQPSMDEDAAKEAVGNILHHTSLNSVPGVETLRREWDPSKVLFFPEKERQIEVDGRYIFRREVDGEAGRLTKGGSILLNPNSDRLVAPSTVFHETSHLVSMLGRQFTPNQNELDAPSHPGHGWVFHRTYQHILRNAVPHKDYADEITHSAFNFTTPDYSEEYRQEEASKARRNLFLLGIPNIESDTTASRSLSDIFKDN